MVLRKLKKLFRRDSRAHMHPRRMGSICQHLDETQRERNSAFHVKVSNILKRPYVSLHTNPSFD